MAGSVTSPGSLINRLPADKQARALQRLSRNANSPGGSLRQVHGRAQRELLKAAGARGIILIEVSGVASLAANVGTVNPPNVATVTIDTNAGTPTTTDITASEQDAITWAGAGQKTLSVTVPTNCSGQALVTV